MITNIFLTILSISFSASLTVLVLLFLSPFASKRYAAKWKYRVWILLGIRLLIPVRGAAFQQPVINLLSWLAMRPVQEHADRISGYAIAEPGFTVELPQQITEPVISYPSNIQSGVTLLDLGAMFWLAGCLGVMCIHMFCYLRFKKQVLQKGALITDSRILNQLRELSADLHIKCKVIAVTYTGAGSPMLTGFFRPVLVLPDAVYDPEELFFIFKHELIHLKRWDIPVRLLFVTAVAIHWVNPFIWLMQKEAAVDMELSCDEIAVQDMDFALRKAYTETLLSTLHKSCAKNTWISTQFYGGKRIMKKRFQNILIKRNVKNGISFMLGAVILMTGLGFLTGCSFRGLPTENATDMTEYADTIPESDKTADASGQSVPESDKAADASGQSVPESDADSSDMKSYETLAYISSFDGRTLVFDAAEWVTVPSKRASKLGISDEYMDSGFYVHNETTVLEEFPVAEDCICHILDWTASYEPMNVTLEEFTSILKEREGTNIPYHLSIQDGKISQIQEQYIP